MAEDEVTPERKTAIAQSLLLHAPPGELNEVFNDVRLLVNDDDLLKERVSSVFTEYNRSHLTPVTVGDQQCLITEFNDLGGSRYHDPRTRQDFRFDPVRRHVTDVSPSPSGAPYLLDADSESWRSSVQNALDTMAKEHYKSGVCCVFGQPANDSADRVELVICIESHNYNAKNYYNGSWRSTWRVSVPARASGQSLNLKGKVKVQTHYYEDGNVQLLSSKDFDEKVKCSDEQQFSKALAAAIVSAENDYQSAVSENFNTMSDSTFKALRRQLPVTRSLIQWDKIINYRIGQELNRAT